MKGSWDLSVLSLQLAVNLYFKIKSLSLICKKIQTKVGRKGIGMMWVADVEILDRA